MRVVPLRKVTGELNPEWGQSRIMATLGSLSFVEFADALPAVIESETERVRVGQALIEEQERIIDEYCGLKEPSEGVKWPPQYPYPGIEEFLADCVYLRVGGCWMEVKRTEPTGRLYVDTVTEYKHTDHLPGV